MTQDIQSIDGSLTSYTDMFIGCVMMMIISLLAAVYFVPLFILPGLVIAGLGIFFGRLYLKAQLSVKRELR